MNDKMKTRIESALNGATERASSSPAYEGTPMMDRMRATVAALGVSAIAALAVCAPSQAQAQMLNQYGQQVGNSYGVNQYGQQVAPQQYDQYGQPVTPGLAGTLMRGLGLGNITGSINRTLGIQPQSQVLTLHPSDQPYAMQAMALAAVQPLGRGVEWGNPQTGSRGTYTPVQDGQVTQGPFAGSPCRRMSVQVSPFGRAAPPQDGVFCKEDNGQMRRVDPSQLSMVAMAPPGQALYANGLQPRTAAPGYVRPVGSSYGNLMR